MGKYNPQEIEKIAQIKKLDYEKIITATTQNARNFFQI